MKDVNLDDLKIDHDKSPVAHHFPWGVVILVFFIGAACGIGALYLWPSIAPQGQEAKALTSNIQPAGNVTAAQDPETDESQDDAPESFTEGGWVEVPSYHPVVVSALIPGRLEELRVLEGSIVKKGQVIGRLYEKDLEDALDQARAEKAAAEADLARMKAGFRVQEVEQSRADVEAAEADVKLKEQILHRTEGLVETGAVSAEDLDRDRAAFEIAKAKLATLRQELLLKEEGFRKEDIQAAEAEYQRRAALLDLASNRLEYTIIKSPMDGRVLERYVTPGTYIPAGNPRIVSLYDPADLQVRVDVRQEHIAGVFVGQAVEVVSDVEPDRSYKGEVIRIEPLADFKKNTIQVKIKLLETSRYLHPEMIARIRFLRSTHDENHGEN
jgi:HlyD family secretion protein